MSRRARRRSVFLAGWPSMTAPDDELLDDVAAVRRLVDLGRQARAASKLKNRQPLRRLVAEGLDRAVPYAAEIADELRVKEVVFGPVEATELRVRPNLPVLGPRLGAELGKLRAALAAGEFEALDEGRFRVAGHELGPDEVLVERTEKEGWAVAASDGATVALDIELDDELRLEGRVYDLIHHVNSLRKEQGLALTDRIELRLPAADADLLEHAEWIARETLAVSVEVRRRRRPRGAAQPGVRRPRRHQAASTSAAPPLQATDSRISTNPPSPTRPSTRSSVAATANARLSRTTAKRPRADQRRRPNRVRLCSEPESNNGSMSPSSRGPSGDSSVMALRSSARYASSPASRSSSRSMVSVLCSSGAGSASA